MDKKSRFVIWIILGSIAIFIIAILSLIFGSAEIPLKDVYNAIFNFDSSNLNHQVIWELRIPRTIGDIFVGASFAVAGAIMQGITRNPLAESATLGVNAGASFAVAFVLAFFPGLPYLTIIIFSFFGAAVAMIVVYGITNLSRGNNPVKLVLAGSAVTLLLAALSQAIAIHFKIGQEVTFFTFGSVAGIRSEQLVIAVPVLIIAFVLTIILSRSISILSLGEDVAKGLGISIVRTKTLCMIAVLLLAGTSVVLAGAIAFVGLIIPHIVRHYIGEDYRKVIPLTMIVGSLFMLGTDLLSRVINRPYETPAGLLFALIGVPFFLYISRRQRRDLGE